MPEQRAAEAAPDPGIPGNPGVASGKREDFCRGTHFMHVVLFHPEIPPNTGNIARLCAAMRVELHLIEPLGFRLENRYLKRAGLDYWPEVTLRVWPDLDAYLREGGRDRRLVLTSARLGEPVQRFGFCARDSLVFGPEAAGLPPEMLARSPHRVRIPIRGKVRSLNLSTAAGIILFQALQSVGLLEAWTAGTP